VRREGPEKDERGDEAGGFGRKVGIKDGNGYLKPEYLTGFTR
jgi:hypothetical protein